jgi:serine/threonine-protein kinase
VGKRRALLDTLASIADGTDAAIPASSEELRIIAGVARLHRTLAEETPGEPDSSESRVIGRISPASPPALGTWNKLILIEKNGEGTFGEVYRAHDSRLDLDVALKLFKPGSGSTAPDADVLLREGRALAQLRHEHVVRVYGADESGGRVGLWMELIRGRTLASLVATQGTYGAREAALIAQDVCRALAAVHQAGLVHGDVKAQNIVREDGGRLVLTDFGSWRPLDAGPRAEAPHTGTPLYLAPEVLRGSPSSVASDIYAAGVLLFHLVTGDFPVKAAGHGALLDAHARGQRTRLSDRRADLPEAFVRLVERATDADPNRRFQTAGEMQAALAEACAESPGVAVAQPGRARWGMRAAALILTAVVLAVVGVRSVLPPRSSVTFNSVAVLPFRHIGPAENLEYLAAAVGDDVTAQLSRLAGIRVVSGTKAGASPSASASDIGRELRVASLVSGSAQITGDRIRVMVELVEASSSRQLWADTFEGTRQEMVSLQGRVVQAIATAIKGQLTAAEASRLTHRRVNADAFQLYLKGRYFWSKRTPEDLRTSIELFQDAIEIQPDAALAHAGLADAYALSGLYGYLPATEAQKLAEASALQALALDDTLAEAHAALATVYHDQWRMRQAESSFARAVALNPNYAAARHWYAIYLVQIGRFTEARREVDYAQSLEPTSPAVATARGVVLYVSRDFESSVAQYLDAIAAAPDFAPAHSALAEAYTVLNRHDEALRSMKRAQELQAAPGRSRGIEAYIMAAAGDRDGALRVLSEAEAALDPGEPGATDIAAAYALLEMPERARTWLDRAVRARDFAVLYINVEPRYERLRAVTDVPAILAAAGVDPAFMGGN